MQRNLFSTFRILANHSNPLGLPKPRSLPKDGPTLSRSKGLPVKRPIPGVSHVIAVASGKGGVGKSTCSVNLALALSLHGLRVGLLDADIYGPSIPRMMNLNDTPLLTESNQMIPLTNYGLKVMSMGFLVNEQDPIVWRGFMVMKALQQLMWQVDWNPLDILVIDMPPGTGDAQLTISQQISLSGAVIISTPQDVALSDAKKAISMFQKILGMIQNMSYFQCSKCSEKTYIFGREGVSKAAKELKLNLIGDIPLNSQICHASDVGAPLMISSRNSPFSDTYMDIANRLMQDLNIKK